MHELQEKFLPEASRQRKIPEWGTRIFSAACVCIQPQTPAELAGGKGVRAWVWVWVWVTVRVRVRVRVRVGGAHVHPAALACVSTGVACTRMKGVCSSFCTACAPTQQWNARNGYTSLFAPERLRTLAQSVEGRALPAAHTTQRWPLKPRSLRRP